MEYGFDVNLYPIQKRFIEDATKTINEGKMGVFASPTGTGKTISLLCTVTNFLSKKDYDDDLFDIIENNKRTKVYYCSRTHTQLNQALDTLKNCRFNYYSVILGSRKVYCVNPSVNVGTNDIITDKCKKYIKEDRCTYYQGEFETIKTLDIEDLKKECQNHKFCPYYFTRKKSPSCEIVFVPYNLIFSKESRKVFDIDLKDKILIVDEAHNIYNSVIDLNTVVISFYNLNLISKSKGLSPELKNIIEKLMSYRGKEGVYGVDDFLYESNLSHYNFYDIEEYILSKNLAGKNDLNIFYDFSKFLKLLTFSDETGRIFLSKNFIKFTIMSPRMYFDEIKKCKSVIFAGGTMDNELSNIFPDIEYFKYDSLNVNFKSFIITHSKEQKPLRLTHENKLQLLPDVSNVLKLLTDPIDSGIIIFVPSYEYLGLIRNSFKTSKEIHYDNFDEYKKRPSILIAVLGGKLSEGINFSDNLCRLLIVIGVPFPSVNVEFNERTKYSKNYGVVSAMRMVNQALGRALRHKNDYAAMVLIDHRYKEYKNRISPWIGNKTRVVNCFECVNSIYEFIKSHYRK